MNDLIASWKAHDKKIINMLVFENPLISNVWTCGADGKIAVWKLNVCTFFYIYFIY